MGLEIESRPSDSPFVEAVWRSRSRGVDRMTSVAATTWDLVVCEQRGRIMVTVQGPESAASRAPVPEEAAFVGITFALGTSMPHLPIGGLVNGAVDIPDATRRTFWLKGSAWRLPDYDNAEAFVRRLVREEVLVSDPLVADVLRGAPPDLSARTVQRRFLAATGFTRGAVERIHRAREAAHLLHAGIPALDVVHRLGYFDQPHLARSLSRFIGRTATQLRTRDPAEPMSLTYKT
ncbi:helix-turn-helix domain-containing protein [Streptomyces sp. B6B3]|uniref:helix-turn-helix domain-containing protein n=1 Tax=Streptomyces sp. B6B3 TaxID=3153570 RepID=UPI00325D1856